MKVNIKQLNCKRCNHKWHARKDDVRLCPSCKSPYWDTCKPVKESDEHLELKSRAVSFLLSMGCRDITPEMIYGKADWKKRLIFDVAGWLNNELVAVECGGLQSFNNRLRKLTRLIQEGKISKLFIWAYGYEKPYEWKPSMIVCPSCGHRRA